MCGAGGDRKADRERRALPGLAHDFDSAVMLVDDPLREAQAESDAFDAARSGGVCAKKALEDHRLHARIDADAGIANSEPRDGTHARDVHDDPSTLWRE